MPTRGLYGRKPAVIDPRVPHLAHHMNLAALPASPDQVQWHAMLPADGIPMLGNDQVGNCVWASAFHYLILLSLYAGSAIRPTTDECIAAYSAGTGYTPSNPASDQGTVVMGPGGMLDYWINTGLVAGGVNNKCTGAAVVNPHNPAELQTAIDLFLAVFIGASISQSDEDAPFLWMNRTRDDVILGGHEFLLTGYTRLSDGEVRYDILTWDGMYRTDQVWVDAAVDEGTVIFDRAFMNTVGISPGGLDLAALTQASLSLAA